MPGTQQWTDPRDWIPDEFVTDAEMNTHVRDNLLAAAGMISDTVPHLRAKWGAAMPDGARGMLRLGASPFTHLALVYDATLGKWVEPEPRIVDFTNDIAHNTTVSTVWGWLQQVARGVAGAYAAGLKLQYQISVLADNSSGSHGWVLTEFQGCTPGAAVDEAGTGMTSVPDMFQRLPASGELTTSSEAFADPVDHWRDVPAGVTGFEIVFARFGVQSNAAPNFTTTALRSMSMRFRWIEA